MSLKSGILGLPNVGKSTCFNALNQLILAEAANYPYCTIEPKRSIVPVPDFRLSNLSELFQPQKTITATVEVVDIAGLMKGASKGAGLGNKFLSHVRTVDALIHVVRCFEDSNITHVMNEVNPIADMEIIETELMLSDLAMLDNLIKSYQRLVKTGEKEAASDLEILLYTQSLLHQGQMLNSIKWEEKILEKLKIWQFLTIKPMLYLANVSEEGFKNNPLLDAVRAKVMQTTNAQVLVSCLKLEVDLIGTSVQEKNDLLALLSCETQGLGELIRATYHLLGLQTFFTAGPKEVKAWTIPVGSTASEAAGYIHSDFQKGFIAAEVISYEDLMTYRSEQVAKDAGKLQLKRANDLLLDGDIVHFRFNYDTRAR